MWKDDTADFLGAEENEVDEKEGSEEEEEESQQDAQTIMKKAFEYTVKIKGLPYKIKKRQLKDFLNPIKPLSLRLVPRVKGIAYVSFRDEKELNQALVKHRGFIDGHRIEIVRMRSKEADQKEVEAKQADSASADKKNKWSDKEPPAESIADSGRIYVRNLCYTCTDPDLRTLFEKYGPLTELHLPIDSYTKKPKGFAFVTFMFPEHAVMAFNELDKTDFQGRLLHLLPAHTKSDAYNGPPPADGDESELSTKSRSSFKKTKKDEIKNESNNPVKWNTLFIRPNAVADIMSKRFKVNKTDLLTQSNKKDNVAVRMALGETQIVNEVRQFLIENNVHLESFERGIDCPRSDTVILVKNLPAETQKEEISQLFANFGLVTRVILPPHGVTCLNHLI